MHLAAILYRTEQREIGLYWLMRCGCRTFGMRVIDVSFMPSGSSPPFRNPKTAGIISSLRRDQCLWKNPVVKPSTHGAFDGAIWNSDVFTS